MPTPIKQPYKSPELRVYGTLRDLTLSGGGSGTDTTPNCSSAGQHVSKGIVC